jgi:hypothetical protein
MLEGILQKMDLKNGFILMLSSPGGDGLAAERIINTCRSYSETGEYWALIPAKAKSAATLISFGASKIMMGDSSELGPVDPQYRTIEDGQPKFFSVHNVITSYDELFEKATQTTGNLEPYIQQLQRYDARQIQEFKSAQSLTEDLAIKALHTGMMKSLDETAIKQKIRLFLTPAVKISHGRPIYWQEARDCGLEIDFLDIKAVIWQKVYELYVRTDTFVRRMASKCFESKNQSFFASIPGQ